MLQVFMLERLRPPRTSKKFTLFHIFWIVNLYTLCNTFSNIGFAY